MIRFLYSLIFLILVFLQNETFKEQQLKYSRVRQAYKEKEPNVLQYLSDKKIIIDSLNLFIQAFKFEKKLEVWAKNTNDSIFKLIVSYDICSVSGKLGPKRKQGDMQIPEGFYHISKFNHVSIFYLSLKFNYPNKSDKILSNKQKPGGEIFIHGDCVTIGCIPITDDKIKELYILCVEAHNAGQNKIPVLIYPAKLTDNNFKNLSEKYINDSDKVNLWTDLKKSYDIVKLQKRIPEITFLENGRHRVN